MSNMRLNSAGPGTPTVIGEVMKRYRECYEAYYPWFREWTRNYRFVQDDPYVSIDGNLALSNFVTLDPAWERLKYNLLKRVVETTIAKVVPTEFEPQTQWSGLSQDARRRAMGQDRLLSEFSRRVNLTRLLKKGVLDLMCSDRAIIKTAWVNVDDKTQPGAESPTNLNDIMVWGGYLHCYNVHPLRFLPAPWSSENTIPWVVEVHTLHRDQIENMFYWIKDSCHGAEKVGGVEVGSSGLPVGADHSPSYLDDMFVVYEMFELPCRKYPRGRHVKATRAKVLYDSEKDREFQGIIEYPYTFVYIGDGENGLMSKGVVNVGVDAQDQLNRIFSAFIKATKDAIGMPWVFDGDVPAPEQWEGGMAVRLARGSKAPEKMSPPPMPPEVTAALGMLPNAIQESIGLHDVSMGQAPKNIESGRGIELLADLDKQSLSRLADATQQLASGVWRRMLVELRLNPGLNPEAIPFRYFDKSVRFAVEAFFLSEIGDQDVVVKAIPGYMNSPAAHRQKMMQAVQLGVITDEEEKREALGLPNAGNMHDEEMWYAMQENEMILRGVKVAVSWFENHKLHARIHRARMLSEDVRALSQTEDGQYLVAFLQAHMEEHFRALQPPQAAVEGAGQAPTASPEGMVNPSMQGVPPEMLTPDASGVQTEEFSARATQPTAGVTPAQGE